MPRDSGIVVDNKFVAGLNTDFAGLSFPEDSVIETFDAVFEETGRVKRRLGIDVELNVGGRVIPPTEYSNTVQAAFNTFVWKAADGVGLIDLLVVQTGTILDFYKINTDTAISQNFQDSLDISTFIVGGATEATVRQTECQFAEGNGFLFVYHPNCDPFYVTYTSGVGVDNGTRIIIKVRDFTGLTELIEDTYRPLSPLTDHRYNLSNQGWGKAWEAVANSASMAPGGGSKVFSIPDGIPAIQVRLGDRVRLSEGGNPKVTDNYMIGVITDLNPGGLPDTMTVNVTKFEGTESITSWRLIPEPPLIDAWHGDIGNYPANSDTWWHFKTAEGIYDPGTTVGQLAASTGPATKGFYILEAFRKDRSQASGLNEASGYENIPIELTNARPNTGAWFAGRVWYSGVIAPTYAENIYFSQIIEHPRQFGWCYQTNDPTSEERFDLLPSDGGVIVIQGSGRIHKLFPIVNGLLVFADAGVWFVTGSQGIGFTATDFTVTKLSDVATLSASSFVSVLGYPCWWNHDGIQIVAPGQSGLEVSNLVIDKIQKFVNVIPSTEKAYVKGAYNPITKIIQWIYRSTFTTEFNQHYEYDRILNFNFRTKAFYPFKITTGLVFNRPLAPGQEQLGICGIFISECNPGEFNTLGTSMTQKYLVRFPNTANTMSITFALGASSLTGLSFRDWGTFVSGGVDFESYFVSGAKVFGQAMTMVDIPYINVYAEGSTVLDLQARWDFTTGSGLSKWSPVQRLFYSFRDRTANTKRVRLRGRGLVLQLRFSAVDQNPMSIIGWGMLVSKNKAP